MSSHLNAALEAFRKQQAQKAAEAVQAASQPKVRKPYMRLTLLSLVQLLQRGIPLLAYIFRNVEAFLCRESPQRAPRVKALAALGRPGGRHLVMARARAMKLQSERPSLQRAPCPWESSSR